MPDEERGADGLGPVAILVILALGACLSVLVWQSLRRHWEIEIERQTESYVSSLSEVLDAEFVRLDGLIRRRAQMWITPPFDGDPTSWHDSVEIMLAENPSILAVLRADFVSAIAGSENGKQLLREVLAEARRQVLDADGEFIAGPTRTAEGLEVFGIQVRASSDATDKRSVFALFRIASAASDKWILNALPDLNRSDGMPHVALSCWISLHSASRTSSGRAPVSN